MATGLADLTARKAYARAMPAPSPPELSHKVLDLLLDVVCAVDPEGRFVFVSASCQEVFGYTPEELRGRNVMSLVHPDDLERTVQTARRIMDGEAHPHFENRYLHKDGRVVDIMWSARWSEDHKLRIAVARDISAQKRGQAVQSALYSISEAAHSTEDLAELFAHIHEQISCLLPAKNFFVALYDEKLDEISYPYHVDEFDPVPAVGGLSSVTLAGEVIRSGKTLLVSPDSLAGLPTHLQKVVGTDSTYWLGVPLSSNHGTFGALVVQSYAGGATYGESDMELLQFVSAQAAAAIERKRMHTRLQHIALYDQLTGLPNRELLHDRLRTALARARREKTPLSLLYLDLDNFKKVNDEHGHATGDALLQEVARRLQGCIRASDTVARLGGDEFVVLIEGLRESAHAWLIAEKIRLALDAPMLVGSHAIHAPPSVGVAVYPQDGDNEQSLLRHADAAMYRAKRKGGNQVGDDGIVAEPHRHRS